MSVDQVLKELGFPLVEGGFGTILADPPWSFSDKGSRIAPDWKESPLYSTMGAKEILDLPVDLLAAPAAHLYIWTTDVHLPLALNCMTAWGFVFKKVLVWVKRRAVTLPIRAEEDPTEFSVMRGPLQIGMGHYYRSVKEICLFGTRGRAPAQVHNLPDVFEAPRTQHSRKPETLHEWAELLSPGPRLELFARRSREGWEAWGDQFPGHDAHTRLMGRIHQFRREARAVTKATRARKRALIRWEKLEECMSHWGGTCAQCRAVICPGDPVHYMIDEPVNVCHDCYVEWERGAPEAPEAAPAEVPF